jgi:hypothetical protein
MARIVRDTVIFYDLESDRVAHDEQLARIRQDYERTVAKAAALAAQLTRGADKAWEDAQRRNRAAAGIRDGITREHAGLDDHELVVRLALHEFRLTAEYSAVRRLTSAELEAERWYVDMIQAEMERRGTLQREAS